VEVGCDRPLPQPRHIPISQDGSVLSRPLY
jgi:hypothetical protein